jgi:hypothetical protein
MTYSSECEGEVSSDDIEGGIAHAGGASSHLHSLRSKGKENRQNVIDAWIGVDHDCGVALVYHI